MDAKAARTLERTHESIAVYQALLEGLELMPGEMNHLYVPTMQNMLRRARRTVECVQSGEPFAASAFSNPAEVLTAMDLHWYFIFEQAFAGGLPNPHMMEDLEAYQRATAVMKHLYIERMVVLDEVRVAGTPDRISMTPWSDRPVIVDIKTGKDMSFGQQAISAQLAAGAWGRLYDPETGSRVDLGCDKDFGIVVHVPVGQAKATLYRVDLRRGTQILGVSTQVHAIRSMKNLMVKMAG